MFVRECAPVITNNTMRGNTALVASGIIASQANGIVVTRNVIQKVGLGLGIFIALHSSQTQLIGWSVILIAIAALNGYKILNSTLRLLEQEAHERGWRGDLA